MPQSPKNPRLNNKVRQSQGLNTGATVNLGETIAANRQIPPTSNVAQQQSVKGAVNQAATENWGASQALRIISPEIGSPEIQTYWGNVAGINAPYTAADLNSSRKYRLNNLPENQFVSLGNSLEDLDELQAIGLNQGTLADFMRRSDFNHGYDRTSTLGERQVLISDQYNILNNYRQELGETVPSFQPSRKLFAIYKDPNYREVFGQYIRSGQYPHLESRAETFFKQGIPLPNAPALQYTTDAVVPLGVRSLSSESESLPMVPSSITNQEPPRTLLRFPTYESVPIQPIGTGAYPDQIAAYNDNFHNSGKQKGELKYWYDRDAVFRYSRPTGDGVALYRGLPTLLPDDDRRLAAVASDKEAYKQYINQTKGNSKNGSYLLTTSNVNNREPIIEDGLNPNVTKKPVEGLYRNDVPWHPTQTEVDSLSLPSNVQIKIEGITADGNALFPLTGGARIAKIPLSSTESVWEKDETGNYGFAVRKGDNIKTYSLADDSMERNPNEPIMMDAHEAIRVKRKATDLSAQNYLNALDDSQIDDKTVLKLQRLFELNRQQLAVAERAYAASSRLEPVALRLPVNAGVVINDANQAQDAIDLLSSFGLNINSKNRSDGRVQVKANGELHIDDYKKLSDALSNNYNRQVLYLPTDVSIAPKSKAFEAHGIPEDSLLQGTEWGSDENGRRVLINPGRVVGKWNQQPIVVNERIEKPIVKSVGYSTDNEDSDQSLRSLIVARDNAKQRTRDKLIESVNLRRLERGEPLLGVGSNGQLFHLPQDSISSLSGEDIDNIVFNAAAAKRQAFNDEANTHLNQALHNAGVRQSATNKQLAIGYTVPKPIKPRAKDPKGMQAFHDDWEIAQSDVHPLDVLAANNQQPLTQSRVIVKPTNEVLDNALSIRPVFTASPNLGSNRFDLSAIANSISPVVRPATVDLNTNASDRSAEFSRLAARERAVREYEARATSEQQLLREWQSPTTVDVESVAIPETNHYFRTNIPIEGDDDTWTYTPRRRLSSAQPTAQASPVIVQDPVNTWNRYIPAATAIAGLGVGGGVVYATSDRDNSEEEQLRQQLMQQQMYLQQIRMGRR